MKRGEVTKILDAHPLIVSLLYDIDLMPEQIKKGDTRREGYMVAVIEHMLAAMNKEQDFVNAHLKGRK